MLDGRTSSPRGYCIRRTPDSDFGRKNTVSFRGRYPPAKEFLAPSPMLRLAARCVKRAAPPWNRHARGRARRTRQARRRRRSPSWQSSTVKIKWPSRQVGNLIAERFANVGEPSKRSKGQHRRLFWPIYAGNCHQDRPVGALGAARGKRKKKLEERQAVAYGRPLRGSAKAAARSSVRPIARRKAIYARPRSRRKRSSPD